MPIPMDVKKFEKRWPGVLLCPSSEADWIPAMSHFTKCDAGSSQMEPKKLTWLMNLSWGSVLALIRLLAPSHS